MSKPKYVSNGTFGCVLRPHVPCTDVTKTGDESKVSKIFNSSLDTKSEALQMINLRKIDPKNIFTIQIFGMCDVDSKEFPEEEIKKCRNMSPTHIAKNKIQSAYI